MTENAPHKPPAEDPRPVALINARLVDPEKHEDKTSHEPSGVPGGLLIKEGVISDLGSHLRRNAPEGTRVIDCSGHVLSPGLIDMQIFTGEPGHEHRETLATASQAAVAGGVTTMICMPDTDPVIDDVALVDFVRRRARDTAVAHIHTMAALTRGLEGLEMSEIGLLSQAGAIAFTNGKKSISDAQLMRCVLSYAKDFDALIVHYAEDEKLSEIGVMNEGEFASRLGLPGIPTEAETIIIERDIRLVELTGARYHAPLISCAPSLDVIRRAKARGLDVTCGVSINHLTLNENDIGPYRTFFKLRPPLRSEEDRSAMAMGLADGDIDCIVSSHDPQDVDDKRHPFAEAADGAIGLETLLPAALRLYHNQQIGLSNLLKTMTLNPANRLGLKTGRLEKGAPADLILIDLHAPWMLDADHLRSKSKNSPFDEARFQGRVLRCFVAGRECYRYAESP